MDLKTRVDDGNGFIQTSNRKTARWESRDCEPVAALNSECEKTRKRFWCYCVTGLWIEGCRLIKEFVLRIVLPSLVPFSALPNTTDGYPTTQRRKHNEDEGQISIADSPDFQSARECWSFARRLC